MIVHQAYRFALDPSPHAARVLASHVGARRFAFNWGLAPVKDRLEARKRGEPVEVPWTLPALRRQWNRAKETALEGGVLVRACGPGGGPEESVRQQEGQAQGMPDGLSPLPEGGAPSWWRR